MARKLKTLGSNRCAACGFDAPEGSKYCPECGSALAQEDSVSADPESSVAIAKQFARGTLKEAGQLTKTFLKSDATQKVAAGAALGAAAATMIPFITLGLGAAIGGGIVAYRRLLK